ncbi:MAG: hypothetical protein GY780_12205 [bacterium]|nr:hypothetical protein [bacterium]
MKIICTYCSGAKTTDGGLIPAVRRYRSERIVQLGHSADNKDLQFMILSGEYGLIDREYPLPYYDHLLQPGEVDKLSSRVATTLCMAGVKEVEYHTAAPEIVAPVRTYLSVMEAACGRASVALRVVILEGDPV